MTVPQSLNQLKSLIAQSSATEIEKQVLQSAANQAFIDLIAEVRESLKD